ALAESVACGANPWFCVFTYMLDHSYEQAAAPYRELGGFLARHEAYYAGSESAAEVAVLYSRASATYYVSRRDALYTTHGSGREQDLIADVALGTHITDWPARRRHSETMVTDEYRGWCLALSREQVPYD